MRGRNNRGNDNRGNGGDGDGRGGDNRGGRGRGRGNGGGGRGRGRGRDNNKRGGYRGGGGGRGRGGGGGRGGRHRRGGGTAESGNARERIQVESGALVLIDQFMLANPQVLEQLNELLDAEPEAKNKVVEDYGGAVVSLSPSTYRIARDPYASTIVIHPDGESSEIESAGDSSAKAEGRVFIDTRCLAMVDRELLDDIALLEKYQQLWITGQDKACRDLLRDNGGAVRYGFQRFGDELGVYMTSSDNTIALWPDVVEAEAEAGKEGDAAAASKSEETASEEAAPA